MRKANRQSMRKKPVLFPFRRKDLFSSNWSFKKQKKPAHYRLTPFWASPMLSWIRIFSFFHYYVFLCLSMNSQGNDLRLKVENWARPISHSMTTHSFTNYAYERAILYKPWSSTRHLLFIVRCLFCFIGWQVTNKRIRWIGLNVFPFFTRNHFSRNNHFLDKQLSNLLAGQRLTK